jgi:hypothetical protein
MDQDIRAITTDGGRVSFSLTDKNFARCDVITHDGAEYSAVGKTERDALTTVMNKLRHDLKPDGTYKGK